jgi:putative peptide zinc metalloprotease protein
MIAAVATFVWWNSAGSPFINYMALALMVVCSVSTVMFNGNPLMRFDGYYVLADWLEIPNLRDRSNRYLQRVVMEHCLGIEVQPEPYMELWRRILFITYALVSWVYRWVITFVILKFMASFLKPYKLEVISTMLALVAAGSMVGWPLFRLGKNLHKRGRLPDMKGIRVAVSTALVVGLLMVFFFVPFPVTRVRQSGLVQVQPRNIVQVHVEVSGLLEKVLVKEGQWVKEGAILAEFKSLELLGQEAEARTQAIIKEKMVDNLSARLVAARDPKERAELEKSLNKAKNEKLEAYRHLDEIVAEGKKSLVLRARRAGVVLGFPKVDEIGKRWEKDQENPFCSIGDPTKLRVLVPVPPSDYELIRDNLKRLKDSKEKLEVTIRVHGHGGQTWTGQVTHLPESKAEEVPLALTNKAGGPLATKPGDKSDKFIPQSQVYLVGIDFDVPDPAVSPGVLAQVKVHCEYRTCAWWVWRTLSATFDLGLL